MESSDPKAHLKSHRVTPAQQGAELARALINIMSEARDLQSTARAGNVRTTNCLGRQTVLESPSQRTITPIVYKLRERL